MDHPGPMARCAQDLDILLAAMADPTPASSTKIPPKFVVAQGLFKDLAEPAVWEATMEVVHKLRAAGAATETSALPAGFADVVSRHRTVMAVEAAQFHQLRLERHPEDYKPNITALLTEGINCTATHYVLTKSHQKKLKLEIEAMLGDGSILLTPATMDPAPDAATTGNPAFNSPWSYTGMPTVSFPTGKFIDGLPLAIQLVGGWLSEAGLIAAAEWCEEALGVGPLEPGGE
jgi:Asp-tRNA(Asn)/Glu-tRNA(Gln) amidotransferase A subunit family amidase